MKNEYEKDAFKKVLEYRLKKLLGNHANNPQVPMLILATIILLVILIFLLSEYMSNNDEIDVVQEQAKVGLENRMYSVIRHTVAGTLDLNQVSFCCQTESTSIEACEASKLLEEDYSCRLTTTIPSQVRNACTVKCKDLR